MSVKTVPSISEPLRSPYHHHTIFFVPNLIIDYHTKNRAVTARSSLCLRKAPAFVLVLDVSTG